MRRWFLSYNSQDLALTQGVEAALRRKDSEAKVFFAPTRAYAPAAFGFPSWPKGLPRQLLSCRRYSREFVNIRPAKEP
jgi:hypothetical protein